MNRVRSLWSGGLRGKVIVLVGGLLGICVVCGVITSLFPRQTPTQTASQPGAQPTLAAAPKATDAPEATIAPTTTSAPPTNSPAPTNTPRPTNTPAPTNTPRPTNTPPPPSVKIGGNAVVQVEGSEIVPLAADEAAFDAFTKAAVRNDELGVRDLVVAGKLFTVPNGTKVLVLDGGGFLMSRLQVRVLEGNFTGRAGWIATEFVRALP